MPTVRSPCSCSYSRVSHPSYLFQEQCSFFRPTTVAFDSVINNRLSTNTVLIVVCYLSWYVYFFLGRERYILAFITIGCVLFVFKWLSYKLENYMGGGGVLASLAPFYLPGSKTACAFLLLVTDYKPSETYHLVVRSEDR